MPTVLIRQLVKIRTLQVFQIDILLEYLHLLVHHSFQHAGEEWSQIFHPPHFIDHQNNFQYASAFIPFCMYQSNFLATLDEPIFVGNMSFPVCTSFKPTLLEGQLCYKLDLKKGSDQGKKHELLLLLDYNTELSIQPRSGSSGIDRPANMYLDTVDTEQYEAKIHINTLSKAKDFGGGSYKMSVVKRMTAKLNFLKMSLKDRNCEVEEYEDCRTRNLIKKCKCVPWKVPGFQVGII